MQGPAAYSEGFGPHDRIRLSDCCRCCAPDRNSQGGILSRSHSHSSRIGCSYRSDRDSIRPGVRVRGDRREFCATGEPFEEVTAQWGTDQPGIHQGIAFGDLDGDGDLDFVVNNLNSEAGIYRNDCASPRVAVRLIGKSPNVQAIGARVILTSPNLPRQMQEVICGGRYLSGFEPLLVFAAGSSGREMSLEISWRNGRRTSIEGVAAHRKYEFASPIERDNDDEPPIRGACGGGSEY
jgi:hypothetical protein